MRIRGPTNVLGAGGHGPVRTLALAEQRGATDVRSQFKKAQILAVLGRTDDAVNLVLECINKGLSQTDVN
jgi:hypothetical protein